MRSIITLVALFLISVTCVFAQFGASQPAKDKWEASVFGGVNSASSNSTFLTPVDDGTLNSVGLSHSSGIVVGGSVIENLGKRFGAELDYTFSDLSSTFVDLGSNVPPFDMDQAVHSFTYSALVYVTERSAQFRPYASIGVGTSLFHVTGNSKSEGLLYGMDLRDRWKFAFKIGGGVKWAVSESWGVRFDFRDTMTGIPDYGLPRTAQNIGGTILPAFRPEGLLHHMHFTAGVYFRFTP